MSTRPRWPSAEATRDGGWVGVVAAGARTLSMEANPPMGLDYASEVDVAAGVGVTAVPVALS